MFKVLMILSFILWVGCGSSSNDKKAPTMDVNLEGLKGATHTPELTEMDVEHGDVIMLNTRLDGRIDGEYEAFRLSVEREGLVALFLSSSAEDLDLEVYNESFEKNSEVPGSNEFILFQAQAGGTNTINIYSNAGEGDFELVVVR